MTAKQQGWEKGRLLIDPKVELIRVQIDQKRTQLVLPHMDLLKLTAWAINAVNVTDRALLALGRDNNNRRRK
jgi:hypothetical protein